VKTRGKRPRDNGSRGRKGHLMQPWIHGNDLVMTRASRSWKSQENGFSSRVPGSSMAIMTP